MAYCTIIRDDTIVHLNVHVDVRRFIHARIFRVCTIDRQNKYASERSFSRDYKTESNEYVCRAHNIVARHARVWDERSRCSLIRPTVSNRSMKNYNGINICGTCKRKTRFSHDAKFKHFCKIKHTSWHY